MNKQILCVSGALTLAVSGSAMAGLVNVIVIAGPNQHPDGLHNTWQVVAVFDDATDGISAVAGLGNNPLIFFTCNGSDIYNQADFAGLSFNDFPSVGFVPGLGELYDSYVTLGRSTFPHSVEFTPGFLGGDGNGQVILGSAFQENDGAWFFSGPPLTVGDLEDAVEGNGTSDVLLAQFTVDAGVGFHLEGNVAWVTAAAGGGTTPFSINCIPSPGVLALFGIAGLVGINRRRRK